MKWIDDTADASLTTDNLREIGITETDKRTTTNVQFELSKGKKWTHLSRNKNFTDEQDRKVRDMMAISYDEEGILRMSQASAEFFKKDGENGWKTEIIDNITLNTYADPILEIQQVTDFPGLDRRIKRTVGRGILAKTVLEQEYDPTPFLMEMRDGFKEFFGDRAQVPVSSSAHG